MQGLQASENEIGPARRGNKPVGSTDYVRLTRPDINFAVYSTKLTRYAIDCPHTHQEHEINVILEGNGEYIGSRGPLMEFMEGDILFFPSGCNHCIVVPETTSFLIILVHPETVINFQQETASDDVPRDLCRYGTRCTGIIKSNCPNTHTLFSGIFEQARLEQEHIGTSSKLILQRLGWLTVGALIRRMICSQPIIGKTPSEEAVYKVKAWIDRNPSQAISVSILAEQACFSPSHFAHLFRRCIGKSPMCYVRDRRLAQAAYLLTHTKLAITQIAIDSGFTDISHFNHYFKKKYNCPPGTFRRKSQK